TFLEHPELCRSYSGYALQWSDPVVQAPGEARSNHWVFTELAKAMGFTDPELGVSEVELVRSVVKDIDQVKESRYTPLARPVPFVDAVTSRGYIHLAAPPGPPIYRPPTVDAGLPLILISPASDKAITSQLFELSPKQSAR